MLSIEKLCEAESLIRQTRTLLKMASFDVEEQMIRLELKVLKENIAALKDPKEKARLTESVNVIEKLMCDEPEE